MTWPPPTISNYYRSVIDQLEKEVDSTSDDRVVGMNPDEWVDYLVNKWGMEPIVLDESRSVGLVEVETEHVQRGYDVYSDAGAGGVVRSTAVRVEVPVVPSDTIREIWRHGLSPNSFHMTQYPEFEYDQSRGVFSLTVQPGAAEVKSAVDRIKSGVRSYNESIESENRGFRPDVMRRVATKRARVEQKHKNLDALAAAVNIPLVKKIDAATAIPTAPKVRTKVVPVLPPASKPPTRPVLEADKFEAILQILDNGCRQFERTPQAFDALTEEGLRDITLGNLNAVFEGGASGETFQGVGKVDIHLRISQGEVFLAELKFWSGADSLREVVGQLRARLTWRDSYGVALVLSRNVGFSDVLNAVKTLLPTLDGFVPGSLQEKAANHFAARFTIPSDAARQASIRILVYNLYSADPSRRQVKKKRDAG